MPSPRIRIQQHRSAPARTEIDFFSQAQFFLWRPSSSIASRIRVSCSAVVRRRSGNAFSKYRSRAPEVGFLSHRRFGSAQKFVSPRSSSSLVFPGSDRKCVWCDFRWERENFHPSRGRRTSCRGRASKSRFFDFRESSEFSVRLAQ